MFGDHVTKVVKAIGDMIKKEDIPQFLSLPHPMLGGKSPLQVIWDEGSLGYNRIAQIIERMASGVFS